MNEALEVMLPEAGCRRILKYMANSVTIKHKMEAGLTITLSGSTKTTEKLEVKSNLGMFFLQYNSVPFQTELIHQYRPRGVLS